MIVVGITGASGVIYGIRLLKALNELNIENSLIISDAAKTVINHEVKEPIEDIITLADNYYEFDDLTASINSGSFKFDGLAIVPCSMKTVAGIASGYSDNLLLRSSTTHSFILFKFRVPYCSIRQMFHDDCKYTKLLPQT